MRLFYEVLIYEDAKLFDILYNNAFRRKITLNFSQIKHCLSGGHYFSLSQIKVMLVSEPISPHEKKNRWLQIAIKT